MSADKTSNKPWLHQWLENIWYHNGIGKYALLPFTLLFCMLAWLRRWRQERQCSTAEVPIIVVGNITVGGTGKTPLVIYIVKQLQAAGYSPAIISRGYKGQAKEWPQRVVPVTPPHLVGDEPVLMAAQTHVPIVVGPNRNMNIRCLLNHHACDVIVSDDGLQHYAMPRDIEVIVVDAIRGFGNGWCLPAGPLREPKRRLMKGDFCIINSPNYNTMPIKHPHSYAMHLQGEVLINLANAEKMPLSQLLKQKVHVVTGIGHPERFFAHLRHAGLQLVPHSFADHHSFQKKDIMFEQDYPVIMTEKDAIKCRKFQTSNCWYLPVNAQLSADFTEQLLDKLKQLNFSKHPLRVQETESTGHSSRTGV